MQFVKNMSIRWKLFGGFGIVLALTAALSAILLTQIGHVNAGAVYLGERVVPSIKVTSGIRFDARRPDPEHHQASAGAVHPLDP